MGAISLYRGNLHRVADIPRRWPMPPRAISLTQFRHLLRKRNLAISRFSAGNPNRNPNPKEVPITRVSSSEPRGSDLNEVTGTDLKEGLASSVFGGGDGDGKEEVICTLDDTHEKEERKRDLEKKLHVLNEKKHYLVQMLKQNFFFKNELVVIVFSVQILNAEEEIKRRSIQSASVRSSVPLQAEASAKVSCVARNSPKISVDVNFGGDVGGESDATANHSSQPRQWPHMASTSPSATSVGRTPHGPFHHNMVHTARGSAPHQATSSSLMASSTASPSRFAPTCQQGHSMSLPSLSVSGTHFAASSPSPAASGGTSSAFRDAR